ncbi:MAG: GIY-YIG nuclease family protein [Candidatus Nanoarchaeia archaeon]|nr:GIY-YIG nuclease family protein [Candidatus Nanoarchaeia archaeon]
MKGIIYCATSPNTKKYYGQTIQGLEKRKQRHKRDLNKGINWVFYQALRKHEWENFKWEIIEEYSFDNKKELHSKLNEREIYWILNNKTYFREFGYNMTKGGDNYIHIRKPLSKESKDKIAKSNLGQKRSKEQRKNMSLSQLGKPHAQNFGPPRYGKDNSAYKIISPEEEIIILDLYLNKGYGSRKIEKYFNHKFSFIKILKFLREKKVWKPHKMDENINRNK